MTYTPPVVRAMKMKVTDLSETSVPVYGIRYQRRDVLTCLPNMKASVKTAEQHLARN
jgi:hypothetical protein